MRHEYVRAERLDAGIRVAVVTDELFARGGLVRGTDGTGLVDEAVGLLSGE